MIKLLMKDLNYNILYIFKENMMVLDVYIIMINYIQEVKNILMIQVYYNNNYKFLNLIQVILYQMVNYIFMVKIYKN